MTKDYKKLYEDLKKDFDAAIEFTVRLEDDLAFLRKDVGLRERLASSALFGGEWRQDIASAMYQWVLSSAVPVLNKKKRGPYKKTYTKDQALSKLGMTKKRKYTKKSKFWAKKKK